MERSPEQACRRSPRCELHVRCSHPTPPRCRNLEVAQHPAPPSRNRDTSRHQWLSRAKRHRQSQRPLAVRSGGTRGTTRSRSQVSTGLSQQGSWQVVVRPWLAAESRLRSVRPAATHGAAKATGRRLVVVHEQESGPLRSRTGSAWGCREPGLPVTVRATTSPGSRRVYIGDPSALRSAVGVLRRLRLPVRMSTAPAPLPASRASGTRWELASGQWHAEPDHCFPGSPRRGLIACAREGDRVPTLCDSCFDDRAVLVRGPR